MFLFRMLIKQTFECLVHDFYLYVYDFEKYLATPVLEKYFCTHGRETMF